MHPAESQTRLLKFKVWRSSRYATSSPLSISFLSALCRSLSYVSNQPSSNPSGNKATGWCLIKTHQNEDMIFMLPTYSFLINSASAESIKKKKKARDHVYRDWPPLKRPLNSLTLNIWVAKNIATFLITQLWCSARLLFSVGSGISNYIDPSMRTDYPQKSEMRWHTRHSVYRPGITRIVSVQSSAHTHTHTPLVNLACAQAHTKLSVYRPALRHSFSVYMPDDACTQSIFSIHTCTHTVTFSGGKTGVTSICSVFLHDF